MRQEDYNIAQELKQSLLKITPLVDFRVNGSRARGDHEDDSDLDIFIEVKSLDPELKRKIRHTTWEVGFRHFMLIQSLIFTKEEIENSPMRASDIVLNIKEEGIAV